MDYKTADLNSHDEASHTLSEVEGCPVDGPRPPGSPRTPYRDLSQGEIIIGHYRGRPEPHGLPTVIETKNYHRAIPRRPDPRGLPTVTRHTPKSSSGTKTKSSESPKAKAPGDALAKRNCGSARNPYPDPSQSKIIIVPNRDHE